MRPKQRKVAAKNMLELRTAEVDADSDGSDTSLSAACPSMWQLLRLVLCHDEFSKALTLLSRGTGFGAAPQGDGASETKFLNLCSFCDVEQLFPDWEDEHTFVSPMRKAAYAWVRCIRAVDLDSNAPGSKT